MAGTLDRFVEADQILTEANIRCWSGDEHDHLDIHKLNKYGIAIRYYKKQNVNVSQHERLFKYYRMFVQHEKEVT